MIAQRVTNLQLALLALQNDSNGAESPGNDLGSDPLEDPARVARRRAMALIVCRGAMTPASWLIADRLAQSWGLSCSALGVPKPADPAGDSHRRRPG